MPSVNFHLLQKRLKARGRKRLLNINQTEPWPRGSGGWSVIPFTKRSPRQDSSRIEAKSQDCRHRDSVLRALQSPGGAGPSVCAGVCTHSASECCPGCCWPASAPYSKPLSSPPQCPELPLDHQPLPSSTSYQTEGTCVSRLSSSAKPGSVPDLLVTP